MLEIVLVVAIIILLVVLVVVVVVYHTRVKELRDLAEGYLSSYDELFERIHNSSLSVTNPTVASVVKSEEPTYVKRWNSDSPSPPMIGPNINSDTIVFVKRYLNSIKR